MPWQHVFELAPGDDTAYHFQPSDGAQQDADAQRKSTPWGKKYDRPYDLQTLVPWGSRCVWYNDGHTHQGDV